jgi:4-nitrophenyl phosphatase
LAALTAGDILAGRFPQEYKAAVAEYQTVIDRLTGYGIPCEPWQLVQSSMATVFLLQKQFPQGGPVYIIGEIGLINTLAKSGFYYSEKDPLAVVVSMDREINYTKIAKAMNFIRSGKPFFATNPDRTFPTPEGLIPGGGAIIAAVQACSEVAPVIAGKPYAPIYQLALDRLKTQPKETLAIGDRLDTDILGGNNARLRTAFVLTGVNTPNDLENFIPKPDLVATDLSALFEES